MSSLFIPSFLGTVQVDWSSKGLEHIQIALNQEPRPLPEDLPSWLKDFVADLRNYLEEARPFTRWPRVNEEHWTDFQRQIYRELFRTEKGQTLTYGELARRCGRPLAARSVGAAMSRNRLPLLIPCHRVLPAGGRLGNYSGGEGPLSKMKLLRFERSELIP